MEQSLADRLILALKSLNLSGYALQKRYKLSGGVVSNWRHNISNPRLSFVDRFCRDFPISKNWLLSGSGSMDDRREPDGREVFLNNIEKIKAFTGKSNLQLSKEINSYATVISAIKAGKASVNPEWEAILERKYGYIYNEINIRKEIADMKEKIDRIIAVLENNGLK